MANLTKIPIGAISNKGSFGFSFLIVCFIVFGFYLLLRDNKQEQGTVQEDIFDENIE